MQFAERSTVYDARNGLDKMRHVLTADKTMMARDIRELEHLRAKLDDLMAPVLKEVSHGMNIKRQLAPTWYLVTANEC